MKNTDSPSHALYHALTVAYDNFNKILFDGKLPTVIFTVQNKSTILGYFAPDRWASPEGERCHEIAINPAHMGQSRVVEVLQTLVHEMVHCWQHCYGTPTRSSYHNKEWSKKMIAIGLQPSSTGKPGGATVGQQMSDYPLDDGPFIKACHRLVKEQAFRLPWIYRLKAITPTEGEEPTEEDSNIQLTEGSQLLEVKVGGQRRINELMDLKDPNAYLYSTYSELMPKDTFFAPPLPSKSKKKTTYQCPVCLTKVWGRPGLNITCCDCNRNFNLL